LATANAKQFAASGTQKSLRIPTSRTLGRYLSDAQTAVGLLGQVTVLLTTDATIRDLNRRFRGKDAATDVLSFSATNPLQSQEKIAGDVAISVETARKQAAEQSHALAVELKVLMLHGLLHLAGYDHETDAGKMQRRERQLRAKLGLPLGLIERVSAAGLASEPVKDEPRAERGRGRPRDSRPGGRRYVGSRTRRRKP
jgi:probable rRNA maturation factor